MKLNRFLWALWLISAAVLYFFENNTGTRAVLFSSLLVPIISIVCARCCAYNTRARIIIPESTDKNLPVDCRMEAGTHPRFLPCVARYYVTIRSVMTGETRAIQCSSFTAVFDTCGFYDIILEKVIIRDVFGLWEFHTGVSETAVIKVLPVFRPVNPEICDNDSETKHGVNPSYGINTLPDEISGIREYIPGDPVRLIHWKITAKYDKPYIRTAAPENSDIITLLLETHVAIDTPADSIGKTTEKLLSVSKALLSKKLPHTVCLPADSLPVLIPVSSETDYESLENALLSTAFSSDGDSFCRVAAERLADEIGSRVIVFSPTDVTDVVSLMAFSDVKLILPDGDEL